MSDSAILDECRARGIDTARLRACLRSHDEWGRLVHAFEYLTVLGIVLAAMEADENLVLSCGTPGCHLVGLTTGDTEEFGSRTAEVHIPGCPVTQAFDTDQELT